jgi:hypothetical protein
LFVSGLSTNHISGYSPGTGTTKGSVEKLFKFLVYNFFFKASIPADCVLKEYKVAANGCLVLEEGDDAGDDD